MKRTNPNPTSPTNCGRKRSARRSVVPECFNSNIANLVFGICLPDLLIGFGASSEGTIFTLVWLLAITAAAVALPRWRGGVRRIGGGSFVALAEIISWSLFFSAGKWLGPARASRAGGTGAARPCF